MKNSGIYNDIWLQMMDRENDIAEIDLMDQQEELFEIEKALAQVRLLQQKEEVLKIENALAQEEKNSRTQKTTDELDLDKFAVDVEFVCRHTNWCHYYFHINNCYTKYVQLCDRISVKEIDRRILAVVTSTITSSINGWLAYPRMVTDTGSVEHTSNVCKLLSALSVHTRESILAQVTDITSLPPFQLHSLKMVLC
jgi:hypothetical protein